MKEKMLLLKSLLLETSSSHFSMYYNAKKEGWTIYFTLKKVFVIDPDPEECIDSAIKYIQDNRIKEGEKYILK